MDTTPIEAPEAPAFVRTITVETWLLPGFHARLAEIDELVERRGLTACGYEVEISEPRTIRVRVATSYDLAERTVVDVTITGSFPRLPGGWTYRGVIERPHGATRSLVHGITDPAEVERLSALDLRCDHCGTKRDRKLSVLARDEGGVEKIIGRTCAKDYFGLGSDPSNVLHFEDYFASLGEEDWAGGARRDGISPLVDLLASAHAVLRAHPWAPKSCAGDFATARFATYRAGLTGRPFFGSNKGLAEEWEADLLKVGPTTDEDRTAAAELIRWANEDLDPEGNDFLNNVAAVLSAEAVESRHTGIAVAAWVALENWLEGETRRKAIADDRATDADASTHLGEVGDRLELTGEVIFTRWFDSDFGGSTLVKVRTDDGNIVTTFSGGKFGDSANKGDTVHFKGTVKEHTEFDGVAETKLTRCTPVKAKEAK